MEITLIALAVLAFASYRITRFIAIDTLIEGFRSKLHVWLTTRTGRLKILWFKLFELTSCTFCAGFWVTLALYSFYLWKNPTDFTRFDWIIAFAIAGIQSLLHTWEGGDE